jgi:hypothetical protein
MLRFAVIICAGLFLLVFAWSQLAPQRSQLPQSPLIPMGPAVTSAAAQGVAVASDESSGVDLLFSDFEHRVVSGDELPEGLDLDALERQSEAFELQQNGVHSLSERMELETYFAEMDAVKVFQAMRLHVLCELPLFTSEEAFIDAMGAIADDEVEVSVAPLLTCEAFSVLELGEPLEWLDALETMGSQGDWFARSIYWTVLRGWAYAELDFVKRYPEEYARRRDLAMRWLLQLAAHGHSSSVINASLAYALGWSVPVNPQRAYFIAYRGQRLHGLASNSVDYVDRISADLLSQSERKSIEARVDALAEAEG